MEHYDQTLQKKTAYSCTIYTMLNIIKFDYGIELKLTWILKIVAYMEKIGVLLPWGASFSLIYPAMTKYIEMKTGLKLLVKKSSITRGLDEKSMWGLGLKKGNSTYKKLTQDGLMTKEDIDAILNSKGGWGHNHAIKKGNKSGKRKMLESYGGYVYEMPFDVLKYALNAGIYYDTARTLMPADKRTMELQKKTVALAKSRKSFIQLEDFIYMVDNGIL